jgi:hypothetical protein
MTNFLWHLRGSVALSEATTSEDILDSIEHLLIKQGKPASKRTRDFVAFDDPLWQKPFRPNWLAMAIYDQGRFWIAHKLNDRRLCYDLRSLHGLIFCLFGAAMAFVLGLASEGLLRGTALACIALAWLYGMNVFLALVRVPRLIRKAARKPQ